MLSVEINVATDFPKSITIEYEENVTGFFEEVIASVRTPHRLYRKVDDKTVELLIGVTHPILMKAQFPTAEELEAFIKKIRLYEFRAGNWKWI